MRGLLLDTNVLSEMGSKRPDIAVMRWLSKVDPVDFYTSTIVIGEIIYGVTRIPDSPRKERLNLWLEHIEIKFDGRILSFDEESARIWGILKAQLESLGLARPLIDLQIAATALRHGLPVVTRNTKHFEGLGLVVINPWSHKSAS